LPYAKRSCILEKLPIIGNPQMRILAYVLALVCAVAAVIYYTMPADRLPMFMPGYDPTLALPHVKHAIAAAVAAVVLFLIGWFLGRRA